MFGDDLGLPERGVLLHIGPHKTGTTAIQGAMHAAREGMREAGVLYAGKTRQSQMAALAVTRGKGLLGDRPAGQEDWENLVDEVRAARDMRVIVSSEFFDDASPEVARMVVDSLGGDRVHVVVTLRPLAKILPSAWQQYVRNRLRDSYDSWLEAMFKTPPYEMPTVTFWKRHHHDVLVERWASIVGPERMLVMVVDESDPDNIMRAFERVAGLPDGLLEAVDDASNRSLTAAETEVVRKLNIAFHKRKWGSERYHRVIRRGAVRVMQLRAADRDEPRITTPAWAVESANKIAAEAADRIKASGVHILGNLATLSEVDAPSAAPSAAEPPMTLEGAASAVVGALVAVARDVLEPPKPVGRLTQSRRNLKRRVRRRLRRVVGRLRDSAPADSALG